MCTRRPHRKRLHFMPPAYNRTGFTLIEVLVVVAIMALLVSILVPSLKRAREQAFGVSCMSNMRSLTLAMHTYIADHGRLPGNFTVLSQLGDCGVDWHEWESWLGLRLSVDYMVGGQPLRFSVGFDPPRHTYDLWDWVGETAPHKGSLFKYVSRDKEVYLCPKDKRGLPDSESPLGGGGNGVFSYTMNYLIGFKKPEDLTSFRYVRDFKQQGNALEPPFPLIKGGTRVVWSQSDMILLMEEHPWNSTNQSIPSDCLERASYLVMRHHPHAREGQGNFAFMDGHVQPKRYPYFGEITNEREQGKYDYPKLLGLDICNEYRYPYDWPGTEDDGDNEKAYIYKLRKRN